MKETPQLIDEELHKRILLIHRYGLCLTHTQFQGSDHPIENLPFEMALQELKRSFSEFVVSKDHVEKLLHILRGALITKLNKFSVKDSHLIIHNVTELLLGFYNAEYFSNLASHLAQHKVLMVPFKTTRKIKAVVLFEDRLIKINGMGVTKLPGLKIYRAKPYDKNAMLAIIDSFLDSFKQPLDPNSWDNALNALTEAEKIHYITKKEQSVGNGSWLTCKLLIFSAVYSIVFQYCLSQGLKDLEIDAIALSVAESWYKLFIVDDRNRAVQAYLALHGFTDIEQPLSVAGRIQSIKNFLKSTQVSVLPVDKEILLQINLKSLNWLLADYLKKGDIGAAHALIEEESLNKAWNPLFYAAKNGKNAIAEMLASNSGYITAQDSRGNTPLHCAAMRGNFDMCKIFLRYRTKNRILVEAQNHEGNTALHEAIKHNKLDVVDLLIKAAPHSLLVQNQKHCSPLKLACDLGNPEAVLRLLGHGASTEGIRLQDYPEEIQKILKKSSTLL